MRFHQRQKNNKMKFRHYLEQIQDVSIYPMISLILFTSIFAVVLYVTFKTDRKEIDDNKNLPLN